MSKAQRHRPSTAEIEEATAAALQARITSIHNAGAARHGGDWLQANLRAVEQMWGTLDPTDLKVKKTVSVILLRVLDGYHLDHGDDWDAEAKKWVRRA